MKSQLIEKQGKYYKECDVVILETSKQSSIFKKGSGLLEYNQFPPLHGIQNLGWKYQNIYFLSDEEIKEGDWQINHLTNKISQRTNKFTEVSETNCSKIIASTDSSLTTDKPVTGKDISYGYATYVKDKDAYYKTLPQPSPEFIQAFIEAYNSGKPITKVLVEYEEKYPFENELGKKYYTLKLKNNQIIIKKIEERMYSQKEVDAMLDKQAAQTTAQILKNQKRTYTEILRECKLQLEYLNEKFGETGTSNALLAKIDAVLTQTYVSGKVELFEIIADRLLGELSAELNRISKEELIKIISNSH